MTGAGVEDLLGRLETLLSSRLKGASVASRERHRAGLLSALNGVEACLDGLKSGLGGEIVSHELRSSLHSLEVLIGRVGVEDVLGEIFSSFCFG